MWVLLAPFLVGITSSIVARVLVALGMSFVSYAVLSTLANTVVNSVNLNYGHLSGVTLAFLNMSGFSSALGIISSALITRAGLMAVKKLKIT